MKTVMHPKAPVVLLIIAVMMVGLYLPFSPLGADAGTASLPLSYFPRLGGNLFSYRLLTQAVKYVYIRRLGQWLQASRLPAAIAGKDALIKAIATKNI